MPLPDQVTYDDVLARQEAAGMVLRWMMCMRPCPLSMRVSAAMWMTAVLPLVPQTCKHRVSFLQSGANLPN